MIPTNTYINLLNENSTGALNTFQLTTDAAAGKFLECQDDNGYGQWVDVNVPVTQLIGTLDEILVNGTYGSAKTGICTLTTPQKIGTTSSPTFAGMLLTGLTASRLLASNASQQLISAGVSSTNLTFSANTLNTIQDINTTASPNFTNVTVSNQFKTSNSYFADSLINLNSPVSNLINFNQNGLNTPTFTTASAGMKLNLYSALSASSVDYSIGVSSGSLWYAIPQAINSNYHRWYAGETNVMSLNGVGDLSITGAFSPSSVIISGLTANTMLYANASKAISSASLNNPLSLSAGVLSMNYTSNLQITGSSLNTIQDIKTSDSPQWTNVSVSNQFKTSNSYFADSLINLNSPVSNLINFNQNGINTPTFTTASAGMKLNLYSALSASSVDYSIGVSSGSLWYAVPQAINSNLHKWYAGETLICSLNGVGLLKPADSLHIPGNGTMTNTSKALDLYQNYGSYRIGFDDQGATKGYIRYNIEGNGSDTYGHIFSGSLTVSPNTFNNALFIGNSQNIGIGTVAPSYKLHCVGDLFGTQYNTTNSYFTDNLISLNNGTSNYINFNQNGVAIPSFTTQSAGTKVKLYAALTPSHTDFALGISAGSMWYSIPQSNSSYYHKWFAGIDEIMTLTGSGNLTLNQLYARYNTTNSYFTDNVLYMNNGTSNYINFNKNGSGSPTFTSRSAGTKVVIYDGVNGSSVDYGIGIESLAMWFSVGDTSASQKFKWYGGITSLMELTGSGNLSLTQSSARYNTINSYFSDSTISLNNGTSNILQFGLNGSDYPLNNSTSTGTKILLRYAAAATTSNFAIGVLDPSILWFSIPEYVSNNKFSWYASASQELMKLDGTGLLTLRKKGLVIYGDSTYSSTSAGLDLYGPVPGWYRIAFDSVGATKGYIRYNIEAGGVSNTWGHIFSLSIGATVYEKLFVSNIGVGINTISPVYDLDVSGTTRSTKFLSNNSYLENNKLYMGNGTSNVIQFINTTPGSPSFTTSSSGSKIIFFNSISGSSCDYAMGIESSSIWVSLPTNLGNDYLNIHGGTTKVLSFTSAGEQRFYNSTFYTGLKAGSLIANTTFTLPTVDATVVNTPLLSDAAGNLSFGQTLASGNYTGTTVSNVTVFTAGTIVINAFYYTRVGNYVSFSLEYEGSISYGGSGLSAYFDLTLPIEPSSNFTNTYDAAGHNILDWTSPPGSGNAWGQVRAVTSSKKIRIAVYYLGSVTSGFSGSATGHWAL